MKQRCLNILEDGMVCGGFIYVEGDGCYCCTNCGNPVWRAEEPPDNKVIIENE